MSDEVPQVGRTLPVEASLRLAHRVGKKCVVTELGDGWICAHGTDGTGRPDEYDSYTGVAPMGSIGVDPAQARVYYHPGDETEDPKALVVSPDNTPFRRSAAGRVKSRSKSFDDEGNPVAEVLFLYASKTGRYDDRLRALDTLSTPFWTSRVEKDQGLRLSKGPTFGQIFDEMQRAATSPVVFEELLQLRFVELLTDTDGQNNLGLWGKVANNAAMFTRERIDKVSDEASTDFDAVFLRAIRETTLEHGGLPAQCHVRERWNGLANPGSKTSREISRNPGDWDDKRKRLGFDWLPPHIDWKRDWLPLIQKSEKQ